jgi:hypothetical protein
VSNDVKARELASWVMRAVSDCFEVRHIAEHLAAALDAAVQEGLEMAALDKSFRIEQVLRGINPFSGGRDGDECMWCRCDMPRGCQTSEEYFKPEHHMDTCELITALAETSREIPQDSAAFRKGLEVAAKYVANAERQMSQRKQLAAEIRALQGQPLAPDNPHMRAG